MVFLAENDSLEELNLADNVDIEKQLAVQYDKPTNGSSEFFRPNHTIPEASVNPTVSKEFEGEQGLCAINTECNNLEVADSEDDEIRVEKAVSGINDCCASSCKRNSSLECQFIQEISTDIGLAKQLQVLDLSKNGFSAQASEALYNSWSSGSRAGLSWRHIENQIVHLSVKGNKCCRFKPCCSKD